MAKKNEKTTVPAVVEPKALKITVKTKFAKDSVEATAIRDIKGRQKKIDKVGRSLVSLWIAQGQELLEFIAITEVSQRLCADLTGVNRSMVNTYCTIASDPRMLNPDFQAQLENFSQKELVKLTKIDDEEEWDEAMETGALPKAEVIDVEVDEDGNAEPAKPVDNKWAKDLHKIIDNADTLEDAKLALIDYLNPEDEPLPETSAIVAEAIELTGEDDIAEQALAIGIKKSVLKKALEKGEASAKTIASLKSYIDS